MTKKKTIPEVGSQKKEPEEPQTDYLVKYGNTDTEIISAENLLGAQKAAHKKAAAKKTIVIYCKPNNL